MSAAHLPPILFTSIPKCGKNVIYSFLFALGYKHVQLKNDDGFYAANVNVLGGTGSKDHYLIPRAEDAVVDYEKRKAEFNKYMRSLKSGQLIHRHFYREPYIDATIAALKLKTIFVYRDPRDCLLSAVNYAFDQKKPSHIYEKLKDLSKEEALCLLLDGDERLMPFAEWFDAYYGWLQDSQVIALKFEDIVGAKGGGSDTAQNMAFLDLISKLNISTTPEIFSTAVAQAFNPVSGTFRKGQIGSWNLEFSETMKEQFNERAGWLLEKWGYPKTASLHTGTVSDDAIKSIVEGLVQLRASKNAMKTRLMEVEQQLTERTKGYQELSARLIKVVRHFEERTQEYKESLAIQAKLRRHYEVKNGEAELLAAQLAKVKRHFDQRTKECKALRAQLADIEPTVPVKQEQSA